MLKIPIFTPANHAQNPDFYPSKPCPKFRFLPHQNLDFYPTKIRIFTSPNHAQNPDFHPIKPCPKSRFLPHQNSDFSGPNHAQNRDFSPPQRDFFFLNKTPGFSSQPDGEKHEDALRSTRWKKKQTNKKKIWDTIHNFWSIFELFFLVDVVPIKPFPNSRISTRDGLQSFPLPLKPFPNSKIFFFISQNLARNRRSPLPLRPRKPPEKIGVFRIFSTANFPEDWKTTGNSLEFPRISHQPLQHSLKLEEKTPKKSKFRPPTDPTRKGSKSPRPFPQTEERSERSEHKIRFQAYPFFVTKVKCSVGEQMAPEQGRELGKCITIKAWLKARSLDFFFAFFFFSSWNSRPPKK